MPVTSPARHSIGLCRPAPRSRKMAMRPSSTMNSPVTGSPLLLSTSSGSSLPQRSMCGQPGQLLARRSAERLVGGKPVDEIR